MMIWVLCLRRGFMRDMVCMRGVGHTSIRGTLSWSGITAAMSRSFPCACTFLWCLPSTLNEWRSVNGKEYSGKAPLSGHRINWYSEDDLIWFFCTCVGCMAATTTTTSSSIQPVVIIVTLICAEKPAGSLRLILYRNFDQLFRKVFLFRIRSTWFALNDFGKRNFWNECRIFSRTTLLLNMMKSYEFVCVGELMVKY